MKQYNTIQSRLGGTCCSVFLTFSRIRKKKTYCIISDNQANLNKSYSVLYSYRHLGRNIPFKPKNQYWIIANFECPLSDGPMSGRWSTQFDVFYSFRQQNMTLFICIIVTYSFITTSSINIYTDVIFF
jgi:hypothetical protein